MLDMFVTFTRKSSTLRATSSVSLLTIGPKKEMRLRVPLLIGKARKGLLLVHPCVVPEEGSRILIVATVFVAAKFADARSNQNVGRVIYLVATVLEPFIPFRFYLAQCGSSDSMYLRPEVCHNKRSFLETQSQNDITVSQC